MASKKSTLSSPDLIYIPGGLRDGSQIFVSGRVPHGEERFHINLQKESHDEGDIAFHFNPRTEEMAVVRNSYEGYWREEERELPWPEFPFQHGKKFNIVITVTEDCFVIRIDGEYFTDFQHRMSYEDVKYLKLSEGAEYFEATVKHMERSPYNAEFPEGVSAGTSVRVRGMFNEDGERFSINFNCDWDMETIGFHFNPRIDEDVVVRNSNIGGWGSEERDQSWFPFKRGQFFDVLIVAHNENFHMFVNDEHYGSYAFRLPSEDIRFLNVEGDVTLMDVKIAEPLPNEYIKEIKSGFEKNDLISVKGFFYPEGERFSVNLRNGVTNDDDIALHVNPRRGEGQVVLNNYDGDWQQEERHDLPCCMNELIPFNVEILSKKDEFKIYFNSDKLASFDARTDAEEIKSIFVEGEAYIYEVKLLKKVKCPHVGKFLNEKGTWMTFIGTPDDDGENVAINLQTDDHPDYGCDVALHFNPRFNEEQVVRNSLIDGGWGGEERDQEEFPFTLEEKFEINILVMDDCYKIFVNGKHYTDFAHRIDLETVSYFNVKGSCDFYEPEFC